jgi:hypothetical protein
MHGGEAIFRGDRSEPGPPALLRSGPGH